ncbi:MAG: OmpH family outer membrane protein [Pseudomonadota bacterium]|nr:OmpH family outer membrane protein [Pseudomonadota bacterium]
MTKAILIAATAAMFALPTVAAAQALPAAVIAVVDVQRASTTCNACRTALTQLESQVNSLRALQTQLQTSLQTEQTSIQTAINALSGRPADAALTARITAFDRRQADAQRQLQAREQSFQRNRNYLLQQIGQRLDPIFTNVLARRGATVMLDSGNVIRSAPALDVTADVIAGLNANTAPLGTTAPAQAQPAAPAGR